MERTIALADGRQLDLYLSGPADGLPLVFHHGTPGSRLPSRAVEAAAHARGLRYVSASRAGYGGSSRRPGRRVVDVVEDTRSLLAALDVRECLVAGHSGGGPHALACAAGLEGVRATLVIAGVAPHDVAGLDFLAGMGEENLVEFAAARAGEAALSAHVNEMRQGLIVADVAELIDALDSILPEVDRAVIDAELGAEVVADFRQALALRGDGWVDDDLAFITDWGFSPAAIATPVTLWQGDLDLMVPPAHGRWLAEAIPGVDAHLLAEEGHISISVGQAEAMLDALLAIA